MSDFDLVGAMEAAGIDEYRINYRTRVVRLSDKGIRLWYTQLFGRAPRVDVSVLSYQGWIFRSRGRKLYLCERCGTEMVYIDPDQGYRC
ncbi:MAG TPA: hypothetical protein VN441_04185, partial [Syntrophomonas sp.]|nr:hypothetical protein [Syntrophomonas sp.]